MPVFLLRLSMSVQPSEQSQAQIFPVAVVRRRHDHVSVVPQSLLRPEQKSTRIEEVFDYLGREDDIEAALKRFWERSTDVVDVEVGAGIASRAL